MGIVCCKVITMDKLALITILGVFIPSLLSATTSHDGIESLVDHLDMKFSQMMKEQQEDIKQLIEENKKQKEVNQENEGKMKKLQKHNIQQQEKITHLEAESMKCSQETLSKIEEQTNQVFSLTEIVDSLNKTSQDHENSINVLSDPPEIFVCGYKEYTTATSSILTFDRLSYARSNQPTGGLDPETGVFTSSYPGTYSVSWSLVAIGDAEDTMVSVYLQKDGEYVGDESRHYSWYTGASGYVDDQGGRTLILHLDLGETLSMFCADCSAAISYVSFCVSLVKFDQIQA